MLGESYERQLLQLFMSFSVASKSEEFSKFTTPAAFKTLVGLAATTGQGIATSALTDCVNNVSTVPLPAQEKEVLSSAVNQFAGASLNNEGSELYTPNAASTFPSYTTSDIVVLEALRPIEPAEQSGNPDETSEDNDDDDDMDLDINDEMME